MEDYKKELFKKFDMTEEELEFLDTAIKQGLSHSDRMVNLYNALVTFHLSKEIEKSSKEIIASNKALSTTTDRHSRILIWLTIILAVLTIVVVIQGFK